ncbi:MAG TPA: undecaprenyl-diphosphate phosphatase [Bauldia sp.]|nr:undecaprenyl-diphosphate phosphatase [Bauldia sp.]
MDLKSILDALVLGLVEGATEFLPVSSTAHILLLGRLLGFHSVGKTFEVMIQLGAILALFSVYTGRLLRIATSLPTDPRSRRFTLGLVIAFLPAAVVGATFHSFITGVVFESATTICVMLILGGIVLLVIDRLPLRPRFASVMDYPLGLCLGIGMFQMLALVPGVSRSGATIVGAMLLGSDKRSAAEFSFFLAMPTMLGAFVFNLWKNIHLIDFQGAVTIAIGFVAAFISAIIVVRLFLGFVSRHGFAPFAWWRIAVGTVGLAAVLFFAEPPGAPGTPGPDVSPAVTAPREVPEAVSPSGGNDAIGDLIRGEEQP